MRQCTPTLCRWIDRDQDRPWRIPALHKVVSFPAYAAVALFTESKLRYSFVLHRSMPLKELELIPTYPNEICPQLLYLGRREHAVNSQIVKDLKIRAYVNCTKHDDFMYVTG